MSLTTLSMAAILALLSPHVIAGISSPCKAETLGHFYQWFFYTHQKGAGNFSVIHLLWWSVLSSPLNGWPGLAGTTNLIYSTAQSLVAMGGGYSSLQGLRHVTK
jgi:hypothetical protein